MRGVRDGYPSLFGAGYEADGEQQEGTEEDAEGEPEAGGGFGARWGWVANIDAVAETARCSWDAATAMSVTEFLNILCYRNDKMVEQERQRKEYLRKH